MTPEQERLLGELLADARETDPMPADVADRLDAVLADLSSADRPAPVTSLSAAAARRRRTARLVLAAAVVVVAGVGVGQAWRGDVISGGSGDYSAATDSAGGQAESSRAQSDQGTSSGNKAGTPPVVRAGHLADDALALQPRVSASVPESVPGSIPGCVLPDTGTGVVVAVTFEGTPAALVFRPAASGRQPVDLYRCGATTPARSVTLPAP